LDDFLALALPKKVFDNIKEKKGKKVVEK